MIAGKKEPETQPASYLRAATKLNAGRWKTVITRLLVSHLLLLLVAIPCLASAYGHYDPQQNTWNATHIVVVENGKVIESWLGDLKVGDNLPKGADRFAQIPLPEVDPRLQLPGKKPIVISGKRRVLFLAFVPQQGGDPKKQVWTGANAPGHPNNDPSVESVAWLDDDRIYSAHQWSNPGKSLLTESGSMSGLKQRVDLGLAIRSQFDAAKSEKDLGQRAERIAFLTPYVVQYAGFYGESDCFAELGKCGKPAVPYLSRYATEEKGKSRTKALSTLSQLGDDGFDAMVKILDDEVKFWLSVAEDLGPNEWIDQTPRTDSHAWRGPHHLRTILRAAHAMKLSTKNREQLQGHGGLRELDKLLSQPRMKPEKTPMVEAHDIVRDILAGKTKRDE